MFRTENQKMGKSFILRVGEVDLESLSMKRILLFNIERETAVHLFGGQKFHFN